MITVPADAGKPDGMTIDAEGMLWIALWEGGCVGRWDPQTGSVLDTMPVPARRVTSCAFGGPQLDELYITTARIGLTRIGPGRSAACGRPVSCAAGSPGVAAFEFAG